MSVHKRNALAHSIVLSVCLLMAQPYILDLVSTGGPITRPLYVVAMQMLAISFLMLLRRTDYKNAEKIRWTTFWIGLGLMLVSIIAFVFNVMLMFAVSIVGICLALSSLVFIQYMDWQQSK